MININFEITNPLSIRWSTMTMFSRKFSKNKAVEVNTYKTNDLFLFSFNWTTRCDHAGVRCCIGLLGYQLEIHQYDTRHWNDDKGRYWNLTDPAEMEEYKKQWSY
jgi:hypothetical protein